MKRKNIFTALIAASGIAFASSASAAIVGGVDFGTLGDAPFNTHLETGTFAQTYVNGVGQNFQAYGVVSTVNGDNTYGVGGSVLYFYAHDYTSTFFNGTRVEFSGGVTDFYLLPSSVNLLNQNSPANIALITAGSEWLRLTGHDHINPLSAATTTLEGVGTLTGSSLSAAGFGLLDVTSGFGLAAVQQYMDANTVADTIGGLADIIVTSSFNNFVLNPKDVAGGLANTCKSNPQAGQWCYQGTINMRGNTIPEPGSIALLGLGALAAAGAMKRKNTFSA